MELNELSTTKHVLRLKGLTNERLSQTKQASHNTIGEPSNHFEDCIFMHCLEGSIIVIFSEDSG